MQPTPPNNAATVAGDEPRRTRGHAKYQHNPYAKVAPPVDDTAGPASEAAPAANAKAPDPAGPIAEAGPVAEAKAKAKAAPVDEASPAFEAGPGATAAPADSGVAAIPPPVTDAIDTWVQAGGRPPSASQLAAARDTAGRRAADVSPCVTLDATRDVFNVVDDPVLSQYAADLFVTHLGMRRWHIGQVPDLGDVAVGSVLAQALGLHAVPGWLRASRTGDGHLCILHGTAFARECPVMIVERHSHGRDYFVAVHHHLNDRLLGLHNRLLWGASAPTLHDEPFNKNARLQVWFSSVCRRCENAANAAVPLRNRPLAPMTVEPEHPPWWWPFIAHPPSHGGAPP